MLSNLERTILAMQLRQSQQKWMDQATLRQGHCNDVDYERAEEHRERCEDAIMERYNNPYWK